MMREAPRSPIGSRLNGLFALSDLRPLISDL
jgi:hypothetical protein